MNIELTLAILFFIFLSIFLIIKRKRLTTQGFFPLLYFSMYKTKIGLKFMNGAAKKFPKTLKYLGNTGVIIGFLGMLLISYELIKNLINLFIQPEVAARAVGLVLPFPVKGGFYVPFTYWIISIFILAAVHETSHGIISRLHNIKIKSSGFAFVSILVPIIPAAFVEPDEKQLEKKSPMKQLAVFAAGPFSNIILGFLVLGVLIYAMAPVMDNIMINNGVEVTGFFEGQDGQKFPAELSGMNTAETITAVDDVDTLDIITFTEFLHNKSPGDEIKVVTNESYYSVVLGNHPEGEDYGYMGITVSQSSEMNQDFIDKYGEGLTSVIIWIAGLLFWLYLLNLGIGLFNLVPFGPVDGGRMLKVVLMKYFDEKKALKIWGRVSMFFLGVILVNILAGFVF